MGICSDATVTIGEESGTCVALDQAGIDGFIEPAICAQLPPIVSVPCGCTTAFPPCNVCGEGSTLTLPYVAISTCTS
jgi:hypothetical protein